MVDNEIYVQVFVRYENDEYYYYIDKLCAQYGFCIQWVGNLSAIIIVEKWFYLGSRKSIYDKFLPMFTEIQLIQKKR